MTHPLLLVLAALAQEPAAPADSGLVLAGGEAQVTLSAEFRLRAESRDPALPLEGLDGDSVHSGRFRLGLRAEAGPELSAFLQFQKSILEDGDPSEDSVHQAVLAWSGAAGFADLEVGRFEMDYGSGLLVGVDDWSPTGRAFDGARLGSRGEGWSADLFWTQPVEGQAVAEGVEQSFGGLWLEVGRAPLALEVYGLARNDSLGSSSDLADTTAGARVRGDHGAFAWSAEAALQFGDHGPLDAGGALAAAELRVPLGARLDAAAGLLYASGDGDAADGDDEAFAPLYEESHEILGRQDLVLLSNVLDAWLEAGYGFDESWRLAAAVHVFRMADDAGLLPVAGAAAVAGESAIGQELDLWLTGRLMPQLELQFGLAQFLAGDAIAGGDDQTWVYAQAAVWL